MEGMSWLPQYETGSSEFESPEALQELARQAQTHKHGFDDNAFLCDICKSIFTGIQQEKNLAEPATCELQQNLVDLEIAANNGCQLCWIRWQQIQRLGRSKFSLDHPIKYGYWTSRVGDGIAFDYATHDPVEEKTTLSIALKAVSPSDTATSSLAYARRMKASGGSLTTTELHYIHSSTNSLFAFAAIKLWMHRCLTSHTECKEYAGFNTYGRPDRRLPTRLIDLGESQEIRPRLCPGQSLATSTPYVSLSHCWGGAVPARLLTHNIKEYHDQLPIVELSSTFRHAMEITKRLGLQYLWIDSLCIVQDDDEDWSREAMRMGDVYKFAIVNIAATHAGSGGEGCFRSRTLMEVEPCFARATWDGLPETRYYCHDSGRPEHEVEQAPLMKRAWVVQEVALAPRIIHYTKSQLYWECTQLRANEAFPDGIPNYTGTKLGTTASAVRSNISWFIPNPSPEYERFAIWKQLLDRYTTADLTFRTKDKLIAISGLARALGSEDEYAAGLWIPHLAEELQWNTAKVAERNTQRRPREYRAPSWSWASVDGPIFAPMYATFGTSSRAVEFLDVHIHPLEEDRFGRIKKAHLLLKGCLVCCRIEIRERIVTTTLQFGKGTVGEAPLSPLKTEYDTYLKDARCGISIDEGEICNGEIVYCLPLRMNQNNNSGILLSPITSIPGQYTRYGTFGVNDTLAPKSHDYFRSYCKDSPIPIRGNPDLYEGIAENTPEGYAQFIIKLI